MVQTKAEAMTTQMEGLTNAIAELNKNLTQKIDSHHADLGNRIGDVTVQIQTLEKKFDDDIQALKVANATVSKRIDTLVQNTHDRIEEVRLETGKRLDDLENDEQYKNAVATIDIQRKKIVSLEKSCHRGLQHGRSYNVEIDGLPVNIGDDPDQLEEAALKLFSAINVEIEDYEIDTIHRLNSKKSPKPTIVRFVSRKTVRASCMTTRANLNILLTLIWTSLGLMTKVRYSYEQASVHTIRIFLIIVVCLNVRDLSQESSPGKMVACPSKNMMDPI